MMNYGSAAAKLPKIRTFDRRQNRSEDRDNSPDEFRPTQSSIQIKSNVAGGVLNSNRNSVTEKNVKDRSPERFIVEK